MLFLFHSSAQENKNKAYSKTACSLTFTNVTQQGNTIVYETILDHVPPAALTAFIMLMQSDLIKKKSLARLNETLLYYCAAVLIHKG